MKKKNRINFKSNYKNKNIKLFQTKFYQIMKNKKS